MRIIRSCSRSTRSDRRGFHRGSRPLRSYTAPGNVYRVCCRVYRHLLVWHFPPGERFLYPVFPLLIFGVYVGFTRLTRALQSSPQRGAAIAVGTMLAIFGGFVVWSQAEFLLHSIPSNMAAHRANLAPNQEAFAWMKANVPDSDAILAYNDPVRVSLHRQARDEHHHAASLLL